MSVLINTAQHKLTVVNYYQNDEKDLAYELVKYYAIGVTQKNELYKTKILVCCPPPMVLNETWVKAWDMTKDSESVFYPSLEATPFGVVIIIDKKEFRIDNLQVLQDYIDLYNPYVFEIKKGI